MLPIEAAPAERATALPGGVKRQAESYLPRSLQCTPARWGSCHKAAHIQRLFAGGAPARVPPATVRLCIELWHQVSQSAPLLQVACDPCAVQDLKGEALAEAKAQAEAHARQQLEAIVADTSQTDEMRKKWVMGQRARARAGSGQMGHLTRNCGFHMAIQTHARQADGAAVAGWGLD